MALCPGSPRITVFDSTLNIPEHVIVPRTLMIVFPFAAAEVRAAAVVTVTLLKDVSVDTGAAVGVPPFSVAHPIKGNDGIGAGVGTGVGAGVGTGIGTGVGIGVEETEGEIEGAAVGEFLNGAPFSLFFSESCDNTTASIVTKVMVATTPSEMPAHFPLHTRERCRAHAPFSDSCRRSSSGETV